MPRKFLLIIITLFCALRLPAQDNAVADSLIRLLPVAKEDTNKIQLIYRIIEQFQNNNFDTSKYYIFMAGGLSEKLHYEAGILKMYRQLSYASAYTSQYDSLIYFSGKALDIATQRKDTFNIGVSLFNIAEGYRLKEDLDKAVELYHKSINMLKGKGYTNIESNLYSGLQNLYISLRNFDKAIEYGLIADSVARKYTSTSTLMSVLNNLGICYTETGQLKKAKTTFLEALALSDKADNTSIEAMVCTGLTDIALRENDVEGIRKYAERGLALNIPMENAYGIMSGKQALACYYLIKKDYAKAAVMGNEALKIGEDNDYKEGKAYVLQTLANLYFAKGEPLKGFDYQNRSGLFQTELQWEFVTQKEAGIRVKYETEKKEAQIRELEADKKIQQLSIRQKNILNYLLIAGAVILGLLFLLFYRHVKQKQKMQAQRINELETEKQLAATEAVLKGEEQERTRLAKDLHDGLGGMLSGIKYSLTTVKGNLIMTPDDHRAFERSMDMLDSSINEMRRVAHNMMPESLLKFGLDAALRDFCNSIRQSGALDVSYQSYGFDNQAIDQTVGITIYRIVQELISNSIRHAGAKTAIVQLTRTDNIISITVEDNGKGFDTASLEKAGGIGWSNIKNRVAFLKGKLDIQSEPGKGTSVLVEMAS